MQAGKALWRKINCGGGGEAQREHRWLGVVTQELLWKGDIWADTWKEKWSEPHGCVGADNAGRQEAKGKGPVEGACSQYVSQEWTGDCGKYIVNKESSEGS